MISLDILAASIETSQYLLKKRETMKFAHEELLEALRVTLAAPSFAHGLQAHAQVSLGALFRNGPLVAEIKHIRPDFVLLDGGRFPVAMIDYLGAGHDSSFDGVKRAVAKKAQMALIQIPEIWNMRVLAEQLAAAGLERQARAA